mmetsp:Transcript_68774/g.61772  ORF Transcript_68774/g.61772 Transcript_68774/m.61772 type:complete len:203 (+) Transcript_68774:18-626(+)
MSTGRLVLCKLEKAVLASIIGASVIGYKYCQHKNLSQNHKHPPNNDNSSKNMVKTKNINANKNWTILSGKCPHPMCRNQALQPKEYGFYCGQCKSKWNSSGHQISDNNHKEKVSDKSEHEHKTEEIASSPVSSGNSNANTIFGLNNPLYGTLGNANPYESKTSDKAIKQEKKRLRINDRLQAYRTIEEMEYDPDDLLIELIS